MQRLSRTYRPFNVYTCLECRYKSVTGKVLWLLRPYLAVIGAAYQPSAAQIYVYPASPSEVRSCTHYTYCEDYSYLEVSSGMESQLTTELRAYLDQLKLQVATSESKADNAPSTGCTAAGSDADSEAEDM